MSPAASSGFTVRNMRTPCSGIADAVRAAVWIAALFGSAAMGYAQSPHHWLPKNFDTTVAGNFRGARIVSREQLDSMRRVFGIRAVINLAKDALPKTGDSEIQWTKDLGIAYLPVYLGTQPPSPDQWRRIRALLAEGGVYVHCAHGADRTGAVIAKYRTEVQGVPPAEAYREARRYGFKPWLRDLRAWVGF